VAVIWFLARFIMKNKVLEMFRNGFVAINRAEFGHFISYCKQFGVRVNGGAILEDGGQVFYNDAPRGVRRLCAELYAQGSILVPDYLRDAFCANVRANGGEVVTGGQVFCIDF
jgi:hypothetical protein